ncbi:uncharacterized protein LOC111251803 [Varroa destructor]|uniref:Lipocalin/cytosolic fatty-acid binding domain-containing protein n=2 Tax=Varroa TaxID=62624 RepID=A0A7M7KBU4_VARDE|nr:uncharacterized protein LOC111251803 [Varroa destructor]
MCRFNVLCFTAVAILSGVSFAEKVILMEDYDPEKVQGTWYVWRINAMIFDEVKCIKFDMLHDIGTEDLYRINSKWINTEGQYKHTEFNVLDDKYHKAQYLFESTADKVALSIMGTDYSKWIVGYGNNLGKESYFVALRTKTVPEEVKVPIEEILKKNEINRDWQIIVQDDCPEEH